METNYEIKRKELVNILKLMKNKDNNSINEYIQYKATDKLFKFFTRKDIKEKIEDIKINIRNKTRIMFYDKLTDEYLTQNCINRYKLNELLDFIQLLQVTNKPYSVVNLKFLYLQDRNNRLTELIGLSNEKIRKFLTKERPEVIYKPDNDTYKVITLSFLGGRKYRETTYKLETDKETAIEIYNKLKRRG